VTGLDYFHARYYDPLTGQFLSADVVQGNAQGTSPYRYVMGNPESRTDPTGKRYTCGNGGGCGSGGGGSNPCELSGGNPEYCGGVGGGTHRGSGGVGGGIHHGGGGGGGGSGGKLDAHPPTSASDNICDPNCQRIHNLQKEESYVQQMIRSAAAYFQSVEDFLRSLIAPWWLNLISAGLVSVFEAVVGALADIVEALASGFTKEANQANLDLSAFTSEAVEGAGLNIIGNAQGIVTHDLEIAGGIAASGLLLAGIGAAISAVPGLQPVEAVISGIGLGTATGATLAAVAIGAAGTYFINQANNDMWQQILAAPDNSELVPFPESQ